MSANPFSKPDVEESEDIFDVDLSEASDSKYHIPEGFYRVRCVDVIPDISQAGNNMWVWTFAVTKGKHQGTELKTWTALTARALWKLVEVGEALKLDVIDGRVRFRKSKPENNPIGRECYVKVIDSEYQGRISSKIDKHFALDSKEVEGVDFKNDTPF